MKKRKLGQSGLLVSELSLGTMSIKELGAGKKIIHKALDAGINFFDTADLYQQGQNESIVGKALKEKRKEIILATKVGNQWRADGSTWDWNPTKAYIKEAVFDSLKRLQTDYIDLYQLHGGTIEDPTEETIEAFEELKQEGWIRYYGISSIRPNVIRQFAGQSNMVSVMTQYSLLDRRPEEFTLDFLKDHNIGVLVRGAVAKGFLLNKTPQKYLNHHEEEVVQFQKLLKSLNTEDYTNIGLAIQYSLAHPAISTIVIGASKVEQLTESIAAANKPALPNDLLEELQTKIPSWTYQQHR